MWLLFKGKTNKVTFLFTKKHFLSNLWTFSTIFVLTKNSKQQQQQQQQQQGQLPKQLQQQLHQLKFNKFMALQDSKEEKESIYTTAIRRRGSVSKEKVKPSTWEHIMKCCNPETRISLPREDSVAIAYKEKLIEYLKTYESIKDQILILKFKFPSKINSISNKLYADVNESTDKSIPLLHFMDNEFPYFVESDIFHYLLWNRKKETVPKDKKEIDQIVESFIIQEIKNKGILDWKYKDNSNITCNKDFEFFWFENPPGSRSVPEVWHIQIFWRLKNID